LGGRGILPDHGIAGTTVQKGQAEEGVTKRVREPLLPIEKRKKGFEEVTRECPPENIYEETLRCLRCDLERIETLKHRRRKAE
ncbi:MAG: hypothetical protein JW969_08435, partial [Spirochaetales bacterium]|nr:hypothetical protein [Spirochaetales bacterium]